jgi:hypothetical protein
MITETEGRKIAVEIDVFYNGIMTVKGGRQAFMFTDFKKTRSTFVGYDLEHAKNRLIEMRKLFGME